MSSLRSFRPLMRMPLRQSICQSAIRPSPRAFTTTSRASSASPNPAEPSPKPISPHVNFYKVFARPVAKVLLMAVFTYQLAYWLWVKLEKDEIKQERQDEIAQLEQQLQGAVEAKSNKK